VILLIVGLLLFVSLVVIHEFGHFIAARRGGVGIEEFGIFFPPRLFHRKTKAGWVFSVNLLPLGGYVKLQGEHDNDTEPGSYGAASLAVKSKINAAGVVMNLITAFVLLTILALIGLPKLVPNQFTVTSDTKVSKMETLIGQVEAGSPAAKAGLKSGDVLVGFKSSPNGPLQKAAPAATLRSQTEKLAGQKVTTVYLRGGHEHQTTVTFLSQSAVAASLKSNNPKGYLGIVQTSFELRRSTWSAPIVAGGVIGQFTALTFEGLGHAVAGVGSIIAGSLSGNTTARQSGQTKASSQVSGPVGIFVVLKTGSILGYQYMLFIIAVISLTLAIMNILPIPALDGGRLWITLIAHGLKHPLSAKREEAITATGFVFLLSLIALITVVDVKRFY
jgi:regulator of sigma E protease